MPHFFNQLCIEILKIHSYCFYLLRDKTSFRLPRYSIDLYKIEVIRFCFETKTDDFYFIEINTVPGQTETSLISQQVKAVGMNLKDFYTELIEEMWH